jgi:Ser/Thr protein kinase RdoA (MazF antagonist)
VEVSADLFGFDPPELEPSEVSAILAEHWSIEAEHRRLRGERSHNSEVVTVEGRRYVLHVVSASERDDVVDLQTTALVHLERSAPDVPTPRVVPTVDGKAMVQVERDGTLHLARLLTYLPGEPFDPSVELPDSGYRAIGSLLGRVAAALDDLGHPAADHFMPWDIANGLITDAASLADVRDRQVLDFLAGLDARLQDVAAQMQILPRRLIHNDGHAGNLLRADANSAEITGLIDFGDVVRTVTAADVAIAAESFATHHRDPGRVMAEIAAGYHEHVPLTDDEITALPELVLARSALGVLLAEYQVRNAPHLAAEEEPLMRDRIRRTELWATHDPALLVDRIMEGRS